MNFSFIHDPIFKFWALALSGTILWYSFKWLRRRNLLNTAEAWPTAQGTIVDYEVKRRSIGRGNFDSGDPLVRFTFYLGAGNAYFQANLNYTYTLTEQYRGTYSRQFDFEQDANSFAEAMCGKSVLVRYNPHDPRKSLIRKQDIDAILQSDGPRVTPQSELISLGPATRKFLAVWALLAFAGFLVSFAVNVSGWAGHVILPPWLFFAMHFGCIISLIPAVFVARKMSGTWRSNRFWVIFRKCSGRLKAGIAVLFAYTMVNFVLFMAAEGANKGSTSPGPLEWRGFSGHWMLFYAISAVICYSAAKQDSSDARFPIVRQA